MQGHQGTRTSGHVSELGQSTATDWVLPETAGGPLPPVVFSSSALYRESLTSALCNREMLNGVPSTIAEKVVASVSQSCPTLCDPVDCSTPGFPVLHHLLEFAQTQVH